MARPAYITTTLIAQLRGKPQIVGDENDRGRVLALHLGDQPENLRVNGDIERGRRLVGDNEARVAGKSQGDQHTLAHAAGQLMRILPKQIAGIAAIWRP